ncbi:hypothetical protein JOE49_003731 [Paenibacillus sp. PvR133]|nr:hypothetical protein [Paenibacillus sp. PvR133]
MGWLSFYKKTDVRKILNIPPHIDPIALVSLGYTDLYAIKPILEQVNWEIRRNLNNLIHHNAWE